ncbi:MAG: FlgD immunoglobulin-like domain containing protein [Syntrophobacteraceae bacterium]|jgi:flagellar basal-body rod modification protein FlgD
MATTTTTTVQPMYGIGSAFIPTTNANSGSAAASSMNMNSFLTMFCAQLQNQDPTNPMQSYELASQLAQFTTVEQLSQATTSLNSIQQSSAGVDYGQITSLVGKQVTAQTSQSNVSSGSPTTLNYTLAAPATVSFTIQDANGNTIYTGNPGSQSAGSYSVPWTGKDSSGNTVADGAYTCKVTATASDGTATTVQTTVQGQVYSCNLKTNPPTYLLTGPNGLQVPVSNVVGVTSPSTS